MEVDKQAVLNLKNSLKEEQYKFLIAKIALHHLKGTVKNRIELQKKVNCVLKKQNLGSVSYGFIRANEKKKVVV
ncbi:MULTISPECIES: hypothetical protein [Bacillus cereus group]|uniref:Uncharacterized protein n=1 Tax=Bacillus mycoides TaxID=1405 RepID=A0ABC9QVS3_BACMY|nr:MULTISPECIES: hypothetical protein [Bacillus cereus group]AJH21929.1 hypothetical protein BG05_5403 [Bacillus mycoides]EEL96117.1 hypothetical protein bmyco0001_54780 [Bacillus mycoides DSM 2048]EJR31163.1 hypothetical protein III_05389 [Bacillus mycoides]MDR4240292.1 hypothetical protein [Bacillus mycoides]MED1426495.1 hypothetical protein [Bacillus mycoides]